MKIYQESFYLGSHLATLETGLIARKATGSIKIQVGNTVVLATTTINNIEKKLDYSSLSVNYIEKYYASNKIPGGFNKREGRPNDHEILTSRLIDRSLRPLLSQYLSYDIQVITTVLSYDKEVSPDVVALIGASASLLLSGIQINTISGIRIGFKNNKYFINNSTCNQSDLNLVISSTNKSIIMVDAEAKILSENVVLGAIFYGYEQNQKIINSINNLIKYASTSKINIKNDININITLTETIKKKYMSDLIDLYKITNQQKMTEKKDIIYDKIIYDILSNNEFSSSIEKKDILNILNGIKKNIVRNNILIDSKRLDGRTLSQIRPINIQTGILPNMLNSVLFTRGNTQTLVTTTIGNDRDSQLHESLDGLQKNRYLFHYNFPPYCVGECGSIGYIKRREIGHAYLARKSTYPVFPCNYHNVVRIVSEVTESDGSSSMATVCGASLSSFLAGIPIQDHVAGIAIGLIKQNNKYIILSDISGEEDSIGDMDLKVAGTKNGITSLQMDVKILDVNSDILKHAMEQAKEGRLYILNIMNKCLLKKK